MPRGSIFCQGSSGLIRTKHGGCTSVALWPGNCFSVLWQPHQTVTTPACRLRCKTRSVPSHAPPPGPWHRPAFPNAAVVSVTVGVVEGLACGYKLHASVRGAAPPLPTSFHLGPRRAARTESSRPAARAAVPRQLLRALGCHRRNRVTSLAGWWRQHRRPVKNTALLLPHDRRPDAAPHPPPGDAGLPASSGSWLEVAVVGSCVMRKLTFW